LRGRFLTAGLITAGAKPIIAAHLWLSINAVDGRPRIDGSGLPSSSVVPHCHGAERPRRKPRQSLASRMPS
jgi:hypothetical protein